MSDLGQVPFVEHTFSENPEPRFAAVLLLDTSGAMAGPRIAQLNAGLKTFELELKADAMASKRVEVAVVTFGPVKTECDFVTADQFEAPHLAASGNRPIGEAVLRAVDMVAQRKEQYKVNGLGYFRPWVFLITGGAPTDDVTAATLAVRQGEAGKHFVFYAVCVEEANMAALAEISVRQPLMLRGLRFQELFAFLSSTPGAVSQSSPGDKLALTAPNGSTQID